jgi:Protein of unknown function (DUF3465)
MKKIVALLLVLVAATIYIARTQPPASPPAVDPHATTAPTTSRLSPARDASVTRAYENQARDVRVEGSGTVERVLSDDTEGSRHERIIVRLPTGQTILIAHNIDLAPRVPATAGQEIEFSGEYVWNNKGGIVHWTHHDPSGRHEAGWIRYKGETYQ